MLYIGSHTNFTQERQLLGVVEESLKYNANAFMFYTGPNSSPVRFKINEELTNKGHELMENSNINSENVFIHGPFIINLANNKDLKKYQFYINFLKGEITRCRELRINNFILHPGSSVDIPRDIALKNISDGINIALQDAPLSFNLLLEFMAGKGTELATNIDELATIINNIEKNEQVGVCLDTCHMNDSGIDLKKFDEFLSEFEEKIGTKKIKLIHLNDSCNVIGAHKDRHANIGYGTIGFNTLIDIIYNKQLESVPKILETPIIKEGKLAGLPPYKYEIENIRNRAFSSFIN